MILEIIFRSKRKYCCGVVSPNLLLYIRVVMEELGSDHGRKANQGKSLH